MACWVGVQNGLVSPGKEKGTGALDFTVLSRWIHKVQNGLHTTLASPHVDDASETQCPRSGASFRLISGPDSETVMHKLLKPILHRAADDSKVYEFQNP